MSSKQSPTDKKMPLPSDEVREKLVNPDFLNPSSLPGFSPDISNASPVPMVTEDPNDPGRTRPTSDEEIVDKVTKTHGVPDLNWSLEEDRKKDH